MKRRSLVAAGCLSALLAGCGSPPDTVIPGAIEYVSAPAPYQAKTKNALRVAAVALNVLHDKPGNLARIEEMAARITAEVAGVRLIHFGEATLGWYYEPEMRERYQREVAEPIPGPATQRLGAIAKRAGVYVAWGMVERAGEELYGAMVLMSPDGKIAAVHRKMLLYSLDEKSGISEAAPNVQVVEIGGLRVGLMVCFDAKSAWLQRSLAKRKVELLLWSAASLVVAGEVSPTARKLGAWLSVANRIGAEGDNAYDGSIFFADPSGAVRASSRGRSSYLVFDVTP